MKCKNFFFSPLIRHLLHTYTYISCMFHTKCAPNHMQGQWSLGCVELHCGRFTNILVEHIPWKKWVILLHTPHVQGHLKKEAKVRVFSGRVESSVSYVSSFILLTGYGPSFMLIFIACTLLLYISLVYCLFRVQVSKEIYTIIILPASAMMTDQKVSILDWEDHRTTSYIGQRK